jgi:hypothetical protein
MHRRSLFAAILLLALVTGGAGNLIASVFCSTLAAPDSSCHQEVQQSSHGSHSGMTHEMHGMQRIPSQRADLPTPASASSVGIEPTAGSCAHCVSGPNLPRTALTLRHTDSSRSFNDGGEPELLTNISYSVLTPRAVNAREHAPPAPSSPLHVRINVFRI